MSVYLLRSVSLRHLRRDPFRTLLILFGIALGVAVFVSVRIANVSALSAFKSTLDVVSGPANLIVRPAGAPIPDGVFPKIWRRPGVLGAAPRVEETLPLTKRGGHGEGSASLMILGIDPFTQADLQAVQTSAQQGSSASGAVSDTRFFTDPGGILLTDTFAKRNGFRPGDSFGVLVNGQTKRLRVLDVLPPGDLSKAFGGDVGVMDIANAQEILDRPGRIDRIDLHTSPADEARAAAAVRRFLPRGVTVGPPSQRMRQAEQMVAAFQLNLTALSLISALVGVFIIYNALLIAVLRRRREIATLRSLGVTRGGIVGMFLAEAAGLGAAGTALGLLLGAWLARFTLQTVSGTISALYLQLRAREIVVTPETLLLGIALGMGSALAAGLAPALEAAATPPAETLREQTAARPARRRALPWLFAGLALLALEGVGSITPGLREVKAFGFGGAFALLLGAALITPALIVGLGSGTQTVYRRLFGVEGDLAVHEIRAALDRSAAVIAALGVAVAMSIGLSIMVGSFRKTVEVWIDETIVADLFIGPAGKDVSGPDAALPPAAIHAIRSVPGIAGMDTFRSRPILIGDKQSLLESPDAIILSRYGRQLFRGGSSSAILASMSGTRTAAVSENFARRFHVAEGDTLNLLAPTGPVSLTIRGVFYDYTSDAGVIMIDRSIYSRLWRDPVVNDVALYLKPGVSATRIRQQLMQRIGSKYDLQITDNADLRANILNIFDQTFAITYALQIIALLVAMLGIGNALIAIVLQRQREIGILRAVGASRGQIVRISLLEASLLAIWGQIVGSVSGVLLALHLVYIINRQFFGWTLQLRITASPFIDSFVLVLAAALVAALVPARMAANVRVAEAVRTE